MFCLWVVAVTWHDVLGGDSKGEGSEGLCFCREVFLFPPRKPSSLVDSTLRASGSRVGLGSAFTHKVPKVPKVVEGFGCIVPSRVEFSGGMWTVRGFWRWRFQFFARFQRHCEVQELGLGKQVFGKVLEQALWIRDVGGWYVGIPPEFINLLITSSRFWLIPVDFDWKPWLSFFLFVGGDGIGTISSEAGLGATHWILSLAR